MQRRPPALLLLSLAIPFGASAVASAATDHPPFMPTRDVRVVYAVQPEGAPAPRDITVYFAADGGLMRIDSPDGQGATILDRDRRLMTILINYARVYMQIPEREELRSPFLLDSTMRFEPAGQGQVTGMACENWTITSKTGQATACVTRDGVVLSEAGVDSQGARGHLVAKSVSYAALPPTLFEPPSGYQRVAHPEGPDGYMRSGGSPVTGPLGSDQGGAMGGNPGQGNPGQQ